MRLLLEASALALALSLLPAVGHPHEKELTPQQHFMSQCLKG
jgi:hypothetical protein